MHFCKFVLRLYIWNTRTEKVHMISSNTFVILIAKYDINFSLSFVKHIHV